MVEAQAITKAPGPETDESRGNILASLTHDVESLGWDGFAAAMPTGDLVQSSAWAASKRPLGFEDVRVMVRSNDRILGGAQIVLKRLGLLGAVGYVARGPLVSGERVGDIEKVLDELERGARAHRIRHLIVQPGEASQAIDRALIARGYIPNAPEVAPSATIVIDLVKSLDAILARMSASQRRRVRQSERQDIDVRLGQRSDIELFHELHRSTARRQGFAPISKDYLTHQWEILKPKESVELFLAYHRGRPLAGIWLTMFNGSVTYRLPGWSGEEKQLQLNIACHWSAIKWAKSNGYHTYDLGGLDRRFAKIIAQDAPMPEEFRRSPNFFKRGFGGKVVILPTAKHKSFGPISHQLFKLIHGRLAEQTLGRRLINRFRNG